MWDDFKKIINFTRGQRRMIFTLSLFILLLVLSKYYQALTDEPGHLGLRQVMQLDSTLRAGKDSLSRRKTIVRQRRWNPHLFDPNNTNEKGWLDLGFSQREAKSIRKYLAHGGHFYEKADLLKIYCISEEDYRRIEKYILINSTDESIESQPLDSSQGKSYAEQPIDTLDLNSCTAEQLMDIRGIGPAISKGIINYRKLLGGYYSREQLKEVYFIDADKYERIKRYFRVKPDSLRKIVLNEASFNTLRKHPYISKKMAMEIYNHRRYVRRFSSLEELKSLPTINDSVYKKISPYFVIR